ncbi:MAG TPA: hypothetical protein VMI31_01335, partial [Fimbriimonadaceae bacterium]|nr:hypothetical protein [Fimbriimonadaceae bacterium]
EAIQRTASMVNDPQAQQLASQYGLNILNLTWEDPGRYKGSSVGPNISDMTIQVEERLPESQQYSVTCMPVIRYPNFSDRTCDIDPEDFTLLVGNQRSFEGVRSGFEGLRRVSLYDFLQDPLPFLTRPDSWRGNQRSLWAPRDGKVLVSAQACFLPVPKEGIATFNPVIFNYQSVSGDPAVLTVLATREGTSTTIIDNKRDAFAAGIAWGQRLFHNQHGMRASLTGQRQSDYQGGRPGPARPSNEIQGMNMVLLIQIPLKQHHPMRFGGLEDAAPMGGAGGGFTKASRGGSDVENAVIGHGQIEGPFTEIDNLNIERDPRYPVRVTVQFYKATSNGIVSPGDMRQIHDEIESVYAQSDSVGSLVTDGETGRATEYYGMKVQPPDWWQRFWRRNEENTGLTAAESMENLRKLLGRDYTARPVCDLYLRDLLRKRPR